MCVCVCVCACVCVCVSSIYTYPEMNIPYCQFVMPHTWVRQVCVCVCVCVSISGYIHSCRTWMFVFVSVCCFVCERVWVFSMTNYRCLDVRSTRRRIPFLHSHLRFRIGSPRWHHKQWPDPAAGSRSYPTTRGLRTPCHYMCILYMCVYVCIYVHSI